MAMQFTAHETKLIERLRKRERSWPRDRWILLIGALLVLIANAYLIFLLVKVAQPDAFTDIPEIAPMLIAIGWPPTLLGIALGASGLGLAIRDWNGNVQRMLLIRLLEEQQKKKTD